MRTAIVGTLLVILAVAGAPAFAENPVVEHQSKWTDLRERDREGESREAAPDSGQDAPRAGARDGSERDAAGRRDGGMSTPAASR